MMYLTNCSIVKVSSLMLLFFMGLVISSCESEKEKFKRLCPLEFASGITGHCYDVPFEMIPNQLVHKVGDTLTIRSEFSNEIEDWCVGQTFVIDSMLFRPNLSVDLWRDSITPPVRITGDQLILVDSIHKPFYASATFSTMHFEDDRYFWEARVVLAEAGRYTVIIGERSEDTEEQFIIMTESAQFEGRCPNVGININNVVKGESYFDEFINEFVYIDKKLTGDNYSSNNYGADWESPFGRGSFVYEHNGAFGFIVEE